MLEDLHVFTTVVEQSSLNKASKLLNLSQPALSRKVAKLEEELGVSLFHRKGKRLELTKIGQLTYTFALEQQQHYIKFLQNIAQFRNDEQSTVTLGASLTTLQTTLPSLVNTFMEKHPNADLKLITGKTHEIVSYLRDNKVDVGIVASSISESGLHCIPLFHDHLELVLPKHHVMTNSNHLEMDQLNGLPMITFSKGTWYRKLIDDLFLQYGIMPDVRMEIDSFEAIIRLLPTSKAAALLPKSYLRPQLLEDNGLTVIHMKELEQTRRTTCLIYADKAELSRSARKLISETMTAFQVE
ncbi:LysR family transcriptional regulator [Paenibacillus sediminis]|uniref:DNA-binding transcriptional LysR family regulator n=1 Tax=Paenibacillus sediminis TaxID=664909 RepID=A0ABS4H5V4_9BACL|nr:LysR family transcriptional regulator [Paenibacillus sediminis]MBP1937907.1 DNA-binding transcriptional LysR family regulator [Paenibacillus sediminis]